MQLPNDHKVSVSKLSAVFNSTSASYKFYWFLAIIEAIEDGQEHIPKHELFARMMANAWYTVNYFQVSFGKQDKIQSAIKFLIDHEQLDFQFSSTSWRLFHCLCGALQRDRAIS